MYSHICFHFINYCKEIPGNITDRTSYFNTAPHRTSPHHFTAPHISTPHLDAPVFGIPENITNPIVALFCHRTIESENCTL